MRAVLWISLLVASTPLAFATASTAQERARPTARTDGVPIAVRLRRLAHRTGPRTWTVRREAMNLLLADQVTWSRPIHAVPVQGAGGRIDGVRLGGIARGSVLATLGFVDDDMLLSLNSHDLTTPDEALAAYAEMPTASEIRVVILRQGARIELVYRVVA